MILFYAYQIKKACDTGFEKKQENLKIYFS
jgi:hypothetical protein